MAILNWSKGNSIGLHFNSNEEYYTSLGYIANPSHQLHVYTHQNDASGAWSGQGKLENRGNLRNLPSGLLRSFEQSGDNRLSVSDYVSFLVNNHNFCMFNDPTGNNYTFYRFPKCMEDVLNTVPVEYQEAFLSGYNMD